MNTMFKTFLPAAVLLMGSVSIASASGRHALYPIPGYRCMSLDLSDQELIDPHVVVPIKAEPSSDAPTSSTAASIVFVASPSDQTNDYFRVLQFNGKTGWIKADIVKPWSSPDGDTKATCTPSMMSDGRPGFAIRR